ncbi:adenylate/guanylate cyclase domain-containing protein [Ruegeria arenilitoris]|uniref:adenylate/guanylate cyclase domain-containing protein n=1 Tax=Ruegeria arenilitoris TaxID=1173585 RepID=UPI003F5CD402
MPTTATAQPTASNAERRQLTVMFCDLVGSTALSESVDPEQFRELLTDYRSAASRALNEFGGYIASYMGDGLLVYFGCPHAHEDDAERAIRAALRTIGSVERLNRNDCAHELQVASGSLPASSSPAISSAKEFLNLGRSRMTHRIWRLGCREKQVRMSSS